MKFIRKLNIIFAILVITANIIFGFVWISGFYYFRKVLAFISLFYILFVVIEMIIQHNDSSNDDKKTVLDNEFAESIYDEESEELTCVIEEDEIFLELDEEEKEAKVSERFKSSVTRKTKLYSIAERLEVEESDSIEPNSYVPVKGSRKFEEVFEQIYELLPEEEAENIKREINYWPPEQLWVNLDNFVNSNVEKDSENPTAVRIYAILCNRTEKDIQKNFKVNGR